MMVVHGDLGNPSTLWTAAQAVFEPGQGAASCDAGPVAIVGGGNSAGQAAMFLSQTSADVEGSMAVRLVFERLTAKEPPT
jgi:thioredoxin reductase